MSLAERLEQATEGSRELDAQIHYAVTAAKMAAYPDVLSGNMFAAWVEGDFSSHYTTSIDAALTLVPEGWTVGTIAEGDTKHWYAELRKGHATSYSDVAASPIKSATPAIAICLAALAARDMAQ